MDSEAEGRGPVHVPRPVQEVVGDRFEIMRVLAATDETKVWLARDLTLHLSVIVKARRFTTSGDLARLRREAAELMRVVAHPGLPMVRSDFVDGDRYCLVSDYVAGRDLRSVMAARGGAGLPLDTVVRYVDQVAATLDHLHTHRTPIVHGDLKPEHLIIAADGRVALVDHGAAPGATDNEKPSGTPGFSAPEVFAGEAVTTATDVYSLSALAVFFLTGSAPRLGVSWPSALADAGLARLHRVLRWGLSWDHESRPARASEFAARLREAAEMDVLTGTITLVLIDTRGDSSERGRPSRLRTLESAGGQAVTTVPLPAGTVLLAFHGAGEAAAAAISLEARAPLTSPIVLHAGDLGGPDGTPLQRLADEAVALRQSADTPMVVCSPPVRMLLGGDESLDFEPRAMGYRVRPAPSRGSEGRNAGNQEAIARGSIKWISARRARPLVGRSRELQAVTSAIDRGRANDESPLILVVGEPGMGKTRLLAEVAGRAAERSECVLVGRCTESGGAFEPFLDALGHDLFPFESGQVERDEEGWIDRRRFFGRIATALRELGGPVTLVLDDVQWIDDSSTALLTQLLDDLAGSLTVLAGRRPSADRRAPDPLGDRLGITVVSVGALEPTALAALAEGAGLSLSADTIDELHALTGGSPFFCLQLLTHLREVPGHTLDDHELPAGLREWILQRLDRLGDAARATLASAAVIGPAFEVVTLADVIGLSPLDALAHLDAGAAGGLLVDGEHPGEFRFVHAIVRTTLASSLSPARRALLHAAIAGRIEEDGGDLANLELALHHWFEADRLGNPLHAGEIAVEVATRSTERLAHERAVNVLDRALAVLSGAPPTADRDRVEARLRVAHGRADFFASQLDTAIQQLYRAADLAESCDDAVTLAQAALVASLNRRHGRDDPDLLRLLERASEHCPSEPAMLPAMLHIRRARLQPAHVRQEQRGAMARLGLADIDRMDPIDRATVETEVTRACWGPDDAGDRVSLTTLHIDHATTALAGGGPARWTGVLIEALNHRSAARVQLGDLIGGLDDARRAARHADEAGTTFLLSRVLMGQAVIHATLGHWEEAERLSAEATVLSSRHNLLLAQMAIAYSIGRDRGQQAQLAKVEKQFASLVDENPTFVAAFALIHAEAGQLDDTRRLLSRLQEITPYPRNWLWLATTVAALEASTLAGDHDLIRRYGALLTRYSGQWALGAGELACWGPVDRVLGLAHLACGRHEQARALLTSALAAAEGQGAAPWVVRCQDGLQQIELMSATIVA